MTAHLEPNGPRGLPPRRHCRNAGAWAVVLAVLLVAAALGRNPPRAGAQPAPRATAAGPHVYRQALVKWTGMAETLTAWEAKGWETFQVVPIANPNPGTGAAMQVAILFRRPGVGAR